MDAPYQVESLVGGLLWGEGKQGLARSALADFDGGPAGAGEDDDGFGFEQLGRVATGFGDCEFVCEVFFVLLQ